MPDTVTEDCKEPIHCHDITDDNVTVLADKETLGQDDIQERPSTLLTGKRLAVVFSSIMIAFSLLALDQTIISTALPTITSRFNALSDISWVATAYFLPLAGFILLFGSMLTVIPAKAVFLVTIALFELGSLLCAVAPSINFLIFGRAVTGVGGAGLWVSILSIVAQITTMQQRSIFMALFGAVYAISAIVGPLLGGVFSDHLTWRWCFWINLPLGGVCIFFVFLLLPNHPAPGVQTTGKSYLKLLLGLDWIGALLNFAMVTMLLLAVQWGGNQKPWSDPAVISTLVLFFVLLAAFLEWERRQRSDGVLPYKLFWNRTVLGASLETFVMNICFLIGAYYLPLYFQVKGHDATKSGIDILPFMVSTIVAAIASGGITTATSYIWQWLFFPPMLASVACGLLFTVGPDSPASHLIGYQILLGIGIGPALQNTLVIAQAEYEGDEALVLKATSLVTFLQLVGSSIGLAVAGAVFASQLKVQLNTFAPQLSPEMAAAVRSSVSMIFTLDPDDKKSTIQAYVAAVDHIFLIVVATAALGSIFSLIVKRRKVNAKVVAVL